MNTLESALRRICRDLDDGGHQWALVGALAVAALAEARATLDVDVAVATASPADSTELVELLRTRGYLWQTAFGAAMTSLTVPDGPKAGLRLDLLFSVSGVESEVAKNAIRIELLPDLMLPVARRGDLLALKLLAAREPRREHDLRDVRNLLATASKADLDDARSAISLMQRRRSPNSEYLIDDLDGLLESSVGSR